MVRRLTQSVCSGSAQACSGLLRVSSGCSRPQTKTEPAKRKVNPDSRGLGYFLIFDFRGWIRRTWTQMNSAKEFSKWPDIP